jgi:hypothetical protein
MVRPKYFQGKDLTFFIQAVNKILKNTPYLRLANAKNEVSKF